MTLATTAVTLTLILILDVCLGSAIGKVIHTMNPTEEEPWTDTR